MDNGLPNDTCAYGDGLTGWKADCRKPDSMIRNHWVRGFKYQCESDQGWQYVETTVKRSTHGDMVDEFMIDIRFAVWGFRNEYAAGERETALRDTEAKTEKDLNKKYRNAAKILDELAMLDPAFGAESDSLRHGISERLRKHNEPEPRRGRRESYEAYTLVLTLKHLWQHFTNKPVNEDDFETFVTVVMNVSGYIKLEGIKTFIQRASKMEPREPIAPIPELEFIYRVGTIGLLYLRHGEKALRHYRIGEIYLVWDDGKIFSIVPRREFRTYY